MTTGKLKIENEDFLNFEEVGKRNQNDNEKEGELFKQFNPKKNTHSGSIISNQEFKQIKSQNDFGTSGLPSDFIKSKLNRNSTSNGNGKLIANQFQNGVENKKTDFVLKDFASKDFAAEPGSF